MGEACSEVVQKPLAAHENQALESRTTIDATTSTPTPSGGTATSESIGDMDNEAVAPGAGVAIVEACSEMVTTPSTTDKKGAVETVVAVDTILVTPAPSGGTASESIGDKNIGAAAPAPESNNVILEACSEDEILPIV